MQISECRGENQPPGMYEEREKEEEKKEINYMTRSHRKTIHLPNQRSYQMFCKATKD